jgi:hypothetical protein
MTHTRKKITAIKWTWLPKRTFWLEEGKGNVRKAGKNEDLSNYHTYLIKALEKEDKWIKVE